MNRQRCDTMIIWLLSILIFTYSARVYSGEDMTYYDEQIRMANKIRSIMIENNICASVIDCQNKQPYFVSPYKNGFSVQLWGVHDKRVLREVLFQCADVFASYFGDITIVISVYRRTKKESLSSFLGGILEKPWMSIEFRGER